jgi:hypothetical protein
MKMTRRRGPSQGGIHELSHHQSLPRRRSLRFPSHVPVALVPAALAFGNCFRFVLARRCPASSLHSLSTIHPSENPMRMLTYPVHP